MFDIGGWEFLVIAVMAIVIIGPKDLPATVRTVTMWLRKLRGFAREFQSGLDDIAREADLDDVQKQITEGLDGGSLTDTMNSIGKDVEEAVDPSGEISDALDPAAGHLGREDARGGEDAGDGEDTEEAAAKRRALAAADEYDDDDFDFDEENEDDSDEDDSDQVAAVSEPDGDPDDAAAPDAVAEPEPAPKTKTGT